MCALSLPPQGTSTGTNSESSALGQKLNKQEEGESEDVDKQRAAEGGRTVKDITECYRRITV
jgi:hypothetical protein